MTLSVLDHGSRTSVDPALSQLSEQIEQIGWDILLNCPLIYRAQSAAEFDAAGALLLSGLLFFA